MAVAYMYVLPEEMQFQNDVMDVDITLHKSSSEVLQFIIIEQTVHQTWMYTTMFFKMYSPAFNK